MSVKHLEIEFLQRSPHLGQKFAGPDEQADSHCIPRFGVE